MLRLRLVMVYVDKNSIDESIAYFDVLKCLKCFET